MGEIRTEMDTEIMTVTTTTEDVNVVAFSIPRLSKRDYVKWDLIGRSYEASAFLLLNDSRSLPTLLNLLAQGVRY